MNRERKVVGTPNTMTVIDCLRTGALALALVAFASPAFAQTPRGREPPPPRPPLDIKPTLKDAKPIKAARAKPKIPKAPDVPTAPTLASASSTPVTLPPSVANSAAAPMMPELRRSVAPQAPRASVTRAELDPMIAHHAELNAVPVALVHRVVMRESRYQPRLVGACGCYGLMQIKHATARAMGYTGTAAGLLDAETNLTYAVKYLAGAYRKANGNFDRAILYYARGY